MIWSRSGGSDDGPLLPGAWASGCVSEYVDDPVTLDGLGHNPHVEDPPAVMGLLAR
jgi:CO dehydrogenase/acetyl-CoA synthase delta subunit